MKIIYNNIDPALMGFILEWPGIIEWAGSWKAGSRYHYVMLLFISDNLQCSEVSSV